MRSELAMAAGAAILVMTMAGGAHAEMVTAAEGFVFDGTGIVNAQNPSQRLNVWDKVSLAELKRRFPGFTVKRVTGDCGGQCFAVSRKNMFFQVDVGGDKQLSFYRIVSDAKSSRDTAGNTIGVPLAKAVGASKTECDEGDSTSCQSKKTPGLAYIAGGCSLQHGDNGNQFTIPACATVGGFEISRVKGGSGH